MRSWRRQAFMKCPKTRVMAMTAITLVFASLLVSTSGADPVQDAAKRADPKADSSKEAQAPAQPEKVGLLLNDSRAFPGYNLINPGRQQTYLYDNEGRVVHTWTSEYKSGAAAYLLENGHLFRPAEAVKRKKEFRGPAVSGRFQEFDWDGNIVWDFEYHSDKRLPHHDAIKLPNGNALLICWEWITEQEAVAAGRRPETVKDSHLQPDCLVEIKPAGKNSGEVVWEWRSWDHLVQDHDRTKPNYGKVSNHPELFDLNYIHGEENQATRTATTKDGKLNSLGYVGGTPPAETKTKKGEAAKKKPDDAQKKAKDQGPKKNPDWMHVNAVAYNVDLDQIVMSSPNFNEIWIIDHSTTTEQAKGHTGGRWGKGGDILYRWGNPKAYRNGTNLEQRLFFQHNVQWISKGDPGAGHLLVFNNGSGRKPEQYSSVDEFIPPTDKDGNYTRGKRGPFGPTKLVWSYTAPNKKDLFCSFISGAQRLPNGNTLVNAGAIGVIFEVTPEGETVWKLANPFKPLPEPPPANAKPAKRFEAFDDRVREALELTKDQRKSLDEIDKELVEQLDKFLTADQVKSFAEPHPDDLDDAAKQPAGEYLSVFNRKAPKLTDAQRKELDALKREFNPRLARLLTDAQKTKVADFKKDHAPAGNGRGGPRKQNNFLFRATRFALDYPAFAGKVLKPGKTLVEIETEFDQQKGGKEAGSKLKTAAAPR